MPANKLFVTELVHIYGPSLVVGICYGRLADEKWEQRRNSRQRSNKTISPIEKKLDSLNKDVQGCQSLIVGDGRHT